MTDPHARQKAYRARIKAKADAFGSLKAEYDISCASLDAAEDRITATDAALQGIIAKLEGNQKSLAVELRQIAEEALK